MSRSHRPPLRGALRPGVVPPRIGALLAVAALAGCGGGAGTGTAGAPGGVCTATPSLAFERAAGGAVPRVPALLDMADTSDSEGSDCAVAPMREWVDANMRDYYLFAERVPIVRLEDYASEEALLEVLRVDPPDHYSHLADEVAYDALFDEGMTFGFGWRLSRTGPETWLFSQVLPGSPFARAGVERGDRLVAIDGTPVHEFVALPQAEQDRVLGLPDTPIEVTFTIESPSAGRYATTVRSAEFALVTVHDVDIAEHGASRVGYLHFTSFLQSSMGELEAAFETLADAAVDELVLDLRYNGGGRVSVAQALGGAVAGELVEDEVFAHFRHNARYAASDFGVGFTQAFRPLDLGRVIVLTSARTCSASELVINALEPFVDVVTIGRSTCGKPYGTAPERRCGRVLNALEVGFANAACVGDYVDGLAPDCVADDDPRTALGRPGDPLYDRALTLLGSGSCVGIAGAAPKPRAGDRRASTEPRFARQPMLEDAVLR